jgi:rfaE bifunctional protein kinase chain/domain
VRFVSEHYWSHLLRADWEVAKPVCAPIEAGLIERVVALIPRADAIVLSDYAKGVLTPRLIRTVIDAAAQSGKPVVVDPKGTDFSVYRGATVITPNRKELAESTRMPVATEPEIIAAAAAIRGAVGARAVLVTLSEEGMLLVTPPASKKLAREISGMAALAGKPARPEFFQAHVEIPCSQVQKSLLGSVKFPAPSRREFCRKPLMSL